MGWAFSRAAETVPALDSQNLHPDKSLLRQKRKKTSASTLKRQDQRDNPKGREGNARRSSLKYSTLKIHEEFLAKEERCCS